MLSALVFVYKWNQSVPETYKPDIQLLLGKGLWIKVWIRKRCRIVCVAVYHLPWKHTHVLLRWECPWKHIQEAGNSDQLWERNWVAWEKGGRCPLLHPLVTSNAVPHVWVTQSNETQWLYAEEETWRAENYPNVSMRPNIWYLWFSLNWPDITRWKQF